MAKKKKLTFEEKRERVTATIQQYTSDITKAVNKLQNCYIYKDREEPELKLVEAMITVIKLAAKLDGSCLKLVRLTRLEKESLRCSKCCKPLHVYWVPSYEKPGLNPSVYVARCPKCKTELVLENVE